MLWHRLHQGFSLFSLQSKSLPWSVSHGTSSQLFLQQSYVTIQCKTFGERKLPLIHSSDGKNKNTVSSCVKVQILSKEFKKQINWGQERGGDVCVCVWRYYDFINSINVVKGCRAAD